MTAPPGHAPTATLTPGAYSGDANHLAYLSRIARQVLSEEGVRVSNREAKRIAIEFAEAREADRREAAAHAEAVAAGGFADSRDVVLREFRAWFRRGDIMRPPIKVSATDNRLGKRGWAVTSA